jgi:hypothetical protein
MSFRCPRRDEMNRWGQSMQGMSMPFYDPEQQPGESDESYPDRWRRDGCCPYCGSMNPETFMAYVRAGGVVGPSDKSYKAYLDDADTLTTSNRGVRCEQMAGGQGKFYFQHLAYPSPLRAEFYDLYTAGKINIGYPGQFYTGNLAIRWEHVARHPDLATPREQAGIEHFRQALPELATP